MSQPRTLQDIVTAMRKLPGEEKILTVKVNPARKEVSYRVKWFNRIRTVGYGRNGIWRSEEGFLAMECMDSSALDQLTLLILAATVELSNKPAKP